MDTRPTATVRRNRLNQYTREEVAKMLGVSYRTLTYQIVSGIIPAPQKGKGKRKYYSPADVEKVRTLYHD